MEEKKLLFKNTSRMGKEEIEVFQNFAVKKTSILASIVLFAICAGAGVGLLFVYMFLGIAFMIAGVLGAVIIPYVINQSVKKRNQDIFKDNKYLNHFEFFEDELVITSEVAENGSNEYKESAQERLTYEQLDHVIVYGLYIFVFINKYQSFILDQRGMTQGVSADLLEYLKSKGLNVTLKKEYKQKRK